jgi:hypothetical protein
VLEPFFGLIACLAIYGGVWLVSKWTSEFVPDAAFEKWCAEEPLIMAFHCTDARDLSFRIRQLVAPQEELVNLHGGNPWQYYRFDVAVRVISDDVAGVFIRSAIPQRGGFKRRTDAKELVERVVKLNVVDEVWMHGQLHPSDARSTTRARASWLGRVADDGALEVTPMIGRPVWAGDLHPDHG